jgi:hypothetical protein
MRSTILLVAVMTFMLSAQTGISGRWKATFKTVKEQPACCSEVILDLKAVGDKIAGTADMGDWPGVVPLTEGTIKADHFSLSGTGQIDSSTGRPKVQFDGTVDGDTMKVTMTLALDATHQRKWDMTAQRITK